MNRRIFGYFASGVYFVLSLTWLACSSKSVFNGETKVGKKNAETTVQTVSVEEENSAVKNVENIEVEPSSTILERIVISPTNKYSKSEETVQYKAKALYSDDTTVDITTKAIWSIENKIPGDTLAEFSNEETSKGLVILKASGVVTVKAEFNDLTAATDLFIFAPTLLGSLLFKTAGSVDFNIPATVPKNAKEVQIKFRLHQGNSGGTWSGYVYTKDEDGYRSQTFTEGVHADVDTWRQEETFWLPVTEEFKVWGKTTQPIPGCGAGCGYNHGTEVYVLDYK